MSERVCSLSFDLVQNQYNELVLEESLICSITTVFCLNYLRNGFRVFSLTNYSLAQKRSLWNERLGERNLQSDPKFKTQQHNTQGTAR
jgi:hypothetical protein